MPAANTERIRDPIHNLIVFDEKDDVDMLAWRLIQTPEFQRLRRIRQLGVSEFVFPGATHTRFAHSLGVYNNARRLIRLIEDNRLGGARPAPGPSATAPSEHRATVIRLAALLHDVGHGPFSHAFEAARLELAQDRGQEKIKNHEFFSGELIRSPNSGICCCLAAVDPQLPARIAEVIEADDPTDIYHAVVSSSFDADRLDYLQRDRYMTGTHSGAIDVEWLINNLVVEEIPLSQEGGEEADPTLARTFAFSEKGRSAAEDFLLARYRLFTNVYLHKTTRGFEKLVAALIRWLGAAGNAATIGIEDDHPLIRFLTADGDGPVSDYAQLDDQMVWGLVERINRCSEPEPQELARRLLQRERPKCVDLARHFGADLKLLESTDRKLKDRFNKQLGRSVFRDLVPISLYKELDGTRAKEHKLMRVRTDDTVREITKFPDTIISEFMKKERNIIRYYFLDRDEFERAERLMKEGR
ncbi:MAG: HD domain-containing protein [Rhodospirillaceae bacterium]|nr:HD domain-containing protein [Rhodospirillaceae bacterium]